VDAPRIEWESVDLHYRGFKVEVKSAAECQSWHQANASPILFSIRKATEWNRETGKFQGQRTRCADVYVVCHYPERDKTKANVLDVLAWDVYVGATEDLNRRFGDAKSIRLAALKKIAAVCKFHQLRVTVDLVLARSANGEPLATHGN
jgi:hypothetical protein